MFSQAELLTRLLKAIDLWPPPGDTSYPQSYWRRELTRALVHLDLDRLRVVACVAILLGL